jgi:peptidyl-prolyl cis-trans isomerase A (cyclophilin A)
VGDEIALTASVDGTFDEVLYSWTVGPTDPADIADSSLPETTMTATEGASINVRIDVIATQGEDTLTGSSEFVVVSYEAKPDERPLVVIDVEDFGEIELAMEVEAAPKTVANFLQYVDEGYYNGVVFHRVVNDPEDFVIQAGAFEPEGDTLVEKGETRDPVESEAPNGLSNVRGTLSMALRGQDADSGDVQFFINLSDDNDFLDEGPPPFTVFAEVVDGLDVVDDIADVDTGTRTLETLTGEREASDVPLEDVIIRSITRRTPDEEDRELTGGGTP